MENFWSNICRCATTLHHHLFWSSNFTQTKVSDFYLANLLGVWILFNEDVFRLKVSVHHTASLNVLYSLNKLIHAQTDLPLLQLICLDMVKKFSTFDLLHDDIHIFFSLVGFSHLHNIFVADQLNDLNLFPQEVSLFVCQLVFNNLLSCNYLRGFLVLTLKNSGELPFTKLGPSNELLIEAHVT